MATITIDKKQFFSLVGKTFTDAQLVETIQKIGVSVEQVTPTELTVEVLPNRPDLLSGPGLARAARSWIGKDKGAKTYTVKKGGGKVIIESSVEKVRPFTACAIIKKLTLTEQKLKEIIQVQEKLHMTFGRNRKKLAIGIYPLEKIKLPITYKAEVPSKIIFQPLEAEHPMTADEILKTHSTGKTYAHLLKDAKVYPIFIDAKNQILSLPPIINSQETGRVTTKTKEVFIECSGHNLDVVKIGLNLIVTMLAELGGEIYQMDLHYGKKKIITPDLTPQKQKVDLHYLNQRIGIELQEKDLKPLFSKMGLGYEKKQAIIPAYRTDIIHQIDLVEDIAIAYGYENLKAEIPNVSTTAAESKFEIFRNKLCNLLVGYNLLELNTYHLNSEVNLNDKMMREAPFVELMNVANQEYNVLRSWLLPNTMQVLSENTRYEYPQKLFLTGTVFKPDHKTETKCQEHCSLAIASAGKDEDFTTIKQILEGIGQALGKEITIEEGNHPSFIPGRSGKVCIGKTDLGYAGEIHPQVLENWKIGMPTVAAEINLNLLFEKL